VGFEQMLRRRHINSDPGGRGMRFPLAVADAVRWPFERAAWAIERRLLWPLQRQLAGRGAPGRGAGVALLAAIAVGAGLVAILILPGGGEAPQERLAEPTRIAVAAPQPPAQAEAPAEPTLQGVPPNFSVGKGVGVSKTSDATTGGSDSAASPVDAKASTKASSPAEAAATTSSAKPVPAGPVATRTARRFAEAFVYYEIGKHPAHAEAVFGETATPRLAKTLAKRPPRLPENAKVPKARVVNLVAGPRHGKAYTISVSLLRVGLTSELRLTLEPGKQGDWRVAEILG
jgi:hypothetical protein